MKSKPQFESQVSIFKELYTYLCISITPKVYILTIHVPLLINEHNRSYGGFLHGHLKALTKNLIKLAGKSNFPIGFRPFGLF